MAVSTGLVRVALAVLLMVLLALAVSHTRPALESKARVRGPRAVTG